MGVNLGVQGMGACGIGIVDFAVRAAAVGHLHPGHIGGAQKRHGHAPGGHVACPVAQRHNQAGQVGAGIASVACAACAVRAACANGHARRTGSTPVADRADHMRPELGQQR